MCTLAAFVASHPEVPLVLAANRDEFFSRPTSEPRWFDRPRRLFAGVDLVAGGTWLGANEYGVVAAVLNRRGTAPPDPTRRSRGSLVAHGLACRTAREAMTAVQAFPPNEFNLCTLLLADPFGAVLLANEAEAWRIRKLTPGLHVVTNRESDALECPRQERAVTLMLPVVPLSQEKALDAALSRICASLADHGNGDAPPEDPLSVPCVHTETFGTRSSSVLVMERSPNRIRFFHASGPPCQTPFHEYPPLPYATRC